MAFCFCDGFDSYGNTTDLIKKWASYQSPWTWSATAGRTGGGGLVAATTGAGIIQPLAGVINSSALRLGFAFNIKVSTTPGSKSTLIQVINQSGNGAKLSINTSGQLVLDSGGWTGSYNICDNNWHWIELTTTAANNVANVTAYVDTLLQFTGTANNDTGSYLPSTFQLVSIAGVTVTIDDIICYDDTGSSLTIGSFPLNPRQVYTLRPTSDSAVQFTKSGGATNYENVDEVAPDSADYVQDGTTGHQDLYGYGNLGFVPASITLSVCNSYLYNPTGGTIRYKQACKSSATTNYGSSLVVPTNVPFTQQAPFYNDPNTGTAWTGAGIDAALFGINVVG